ncbi:Sensory subunit of low CO2-induced protein complex, putative [hydrothermal vent metagenome]|uniref:Sensory subunit of low CO2-induced protein complex, putative n=1 Tax=hydrothermal vent metagenome TaxID=652676 RepID=A0A3B0TRL5_9ZZZZ
MKTTQLIIVLLSLSLFISCKNEQKTDVQKSTETTTTTQEEHKGQATVAAGEGEQKNALQVAKSLDDFTTLVAAIEAGDVEDAVVNVGPLTIFAPVNDAFAKIQDAVDDLLKPENKETLAFVLKNHVAPSNYPIKQLKKEAEKGRKLYMATGKYLVVENKDGKVFVGGTEILKSVKVSNGWIHVIGDVLVPSDE